jgi:hypothetical protein
MSGAHGANVFTPGSYITVPQDLDGDGIYETCGVKDSDNNGITDELDKANYEPDRRFDSYHNFGAVNACHNFAGTSQQFSTIPVSTWDPATDTYGSRCCFYHNVLDFETYEDFGESSFSLWGKYGGDGV